MILVWYDEWHPFESEAVASYYIPHKASFARVVPDQIWIDFAAAQRTLYTLSIQIHDCPRLANHA